MTHIAVIDIGKTNAKLVLVRGDDLHEMAVLTCPNTVLHTPPYPHYDLDALWAFFVAGLRAFQRQFGVDAISVTTHGAAAVLLDSAGALAAPCLDYEHDGPDTLADAYNAIRPDFSQTGSARLPAGLNLGAQIYWQLQRDPSLAARVAHVLTYPQYWGWRLTGAMACDLSSLGCHTDLWNPWQGRFSPLVAQLGLTGKIAPPRPPNQILGQLRAELGQELGLQKPIPVSVGIHDSNASLYPYFMLQKGAFSVVSSGTWTVCMAVGGDSVALNPARDVLVNVGGNGQPVPSARFMGGREYDLIADGQFAASTSADRAAVLAANIALLPAVVGSAGPYQGRSFAWTHVPETLPQRLVALGWYLALMTRTCLDLIGARGPVIIEGPLARNPDYLDMITALSPDGVLVAQSSTGTSSGAACLLTARAPQGQLAPWPLPSLAAALREYARAWRVQVDGAA